MPTFIHEYAHAEQSLRGADRRTFSRHRPQDFVNPNGAPHGFGYITAGRKKARGLGRRNGDTLNDKRTGDPVQDEQKDLQYLGHAIEIDSWASGAATELMDEIMSDERRSYRRGERNRKIAEIKRDISQGYVNTRSLDRYTNMVYNSFNGHFKRDGVDVDHNEIMKVWKIFAKKLATKLDSYRDATAPTMTGRLPLDGASSEPVQHDRGIVDDPDSLSTRFRNIIAGKPFGEAVKLLAQDAARSYIERRDVKDIDDLEYSLRASRPDNYRYIQFITDHYFAGEWNDAREEKIENVFGRIFHRDIRGMISGEPVRQAA
jgi:hypothetical protein